MLDTEERGANRGRRAALPAQPPHAPATLAAKGRYPGREGAPAGFLCRPCAPIGRQGGVAAEPSDGELPGEHLRALPRRCKAGSFAIISRTLP
jgi:hypothetical protein